MAHRFASARIPGVGARLTAKPAGWFAHYHQAIFLINEHEVYMDLGIAGKWALVCGASKGLGFGCAQALLREGVNVLIVARGAPDLQAAAATLLADPARQAINAGMDATIERILAAWRRAMASGLG